MDKKVEKLYEVLAKHNMKRNERFDDYGWPNKISSRGDCEICLLTDYDFASCNDLTKTSYCLTKEEEKKRSRETEKKKDLKKIFLKFLKTKRLSGKLTDAFI